MSSEWPSVRLGDHVESCLGKMLDAKKNKGVPQPYLGNSNVRWGNFDVSDLAEMRFEPHEDDRYGLQPGDLVVCEGGEPGRCAIWIGPAGMKIQKALHRIRPKVGFNNYYLFYWFCHAAKVGLLDPYFTGTTIKHLTGKAIASLEVPLPPIDAQVAMMDVLKSLDDRITLLRETNATIEAIAQALFKSWFVDFDPVRAKMEGRAPEGMDEATAALFPDSFEESELGLVPTGWRVGPIGQSISVVDFVANGSFASLKENVTLQNTRAYALYLRTTDFNSGYAGDFRYVSKPAYQFLSKSSLDGTEVVISNVGDVGTVFRPPTWLGLPMTLGSNAVALKARGHSAFMYLYFSGAKGQHDIQSIVTGSAQLKFNKTNFRSLLIALPEAVVLERFESIAGALLSTIDNNLATAQTQTTLRDTLIPRLISGQLRLPPTESPVPEPTL